MWKPHQFVLKSMEKPCERHTSEYYLLTTRYVSLKTGETYTPEKRNTQRKTGTGRMKRMKYYVSLT